MIFFVYVRNRFLFNIFHLCFFFVNRSSKKLRFLFVFKNISKDSDEAKIKTLVLPSIYKSFISHYLLLLNFDIKIIAEAAMLWTWPSFSRIIFEERQIVNINNSFCWFPTHWNWHGLTFFIFLLFSFLNASPYWARDKNSKTKTKTKSCYDHHMRYNVSTASVRFHSSLSCFLFLFAVQSFIVWLAFQQTVPWLFRCALY